MNQSDPKLLEGLRAMAADGPREAPASVEERLLGALRRRTRARRRNLGLAMGAGAVAAGIAMMLWIRPAPAVAPAYVASLNVPAVQGAVASAAVAPTVLQTPPKAAPVRRRHRRDTEVAMNFYRLPDTEDLPPVESATIVRVRLPMSSLRLMGFPVSEEQAAESVQADVLLGQDGLARGVRLVE